MDCLHRWTPTDATGPKPALAPKARLFLSYGRRDASALADRLEKDLTDKGYDVWRDRKNIVPGRDFMREIEDGLRSTQLVIALLSPHSVRRSGDPASPDDVDSVCLDELHLARFSCKLPIVPVLAAPCEPPLVIYRLDYIELLQWSDFAGQYQAGFRRLLEAIEAALNGEVHYRSWDDRLRPWDFAAFLHEKRRDFCGREWLFHRIDDWRLHRAERALLITGDPGVGKSAIVAQMVHQDPRVLAYHCCQAGTPETLRPDRFVRSLAAQLASRLPAYAAALATAAIEEALNLDPVSAFERGVLTPLEAIHHPADDIRYVLIDSLDEALAHPESLNIVAVLAALLNRLPGWLRLVSTTRKDDAVLRRGELSGLRAWEIGAEDKRNLDDLERFLAHRLGQPELQARLAASGIPAGEAIRRLRERSAGNFLWVQQALLGIERDQYRFDRLDDLPPGLDGLYLDSFRRKFPDEVSYEVPRRVLQVIVAAAEPLTESELAGATVLDSEDVLPAALRSLSAFLPCRDGHFAVYHKSLADWLTAPATRGTLHHTSPKRGHERLADWCWAEYQREPRSMSAYALRSLPSHLIAAARWDNLAALLFDLSFLEAKAEAGLIFSLALDFTRTVERMPEAHSARRNLRLLEQALRSDLHFLARHPATLFQCLWNQCWWYDCPEAAAHYDPPPGGWSDDAPPWSRPAAGRLATLLESWRAARERRGPSSTWLRSLSPPELALGSAQAACLRGHERMVMSVTYSPDGRRIVSGSDDRTVRVWDADSGAELACLRGHEDEVTSVAYSPDGRRIVSGSWDKTVRVWDADRGTELTCFRGHEDEVTSVAYSSDGRRIASGSDDRTARVWDADSGAELACFRGHEDEVTSVAYSPDGRRIASGSADNTVRVWDADSGVELTCLRGHERMVMSVTYSPDGRRIVSGSDDRTVRVWDANSGVELTCLRGHQRIVTSVAYSPDGQRIASGSGDKTLRVWDAYSGVELACLRGHQRSAESLAYSPDGRRIASGLSDNTVRVWDANRGAKMAYLREHEGSVKSVGYSPDGRRIASGSRDKTVRVWDADSGTELACLHGHESSVKSVAYSPDGRRIASGSRDKTVRVWDVDSCTELACFHGHEDAVESVGYSPDGRRIASGSADNTVRVWDVDRGVELACLRGHERIVTSVAYSPDGRRIVSASRDKTVRWWEADSGASLACLPRRESSVTSVAYSPDGQRIVSASRDKTVRVRDASNVRTLEVIQGWGDVAAIAAGGEALPWRAIGREFETVIEPAGGGDPIAWFPVEFRQITTCPYGRAWAGSAATQKHLYIIHLEGQPEPRAKPSGGKAQ